MKLLVCIIIAVVVVSAIVAIRPTNSTPIRMINPDHSLTPAPIDDPLAIAVMRRRSYPGSQLTVEQQLDDGSNYTRSVVSYQSDGLKQYALLTIPTGTIPPNGWPVIVFNHGYIPPEQYRTTERYVAYVDAFARHGYIVIKPDYRGNGSSEGKPEGAYYSPAYTVDVLNALASIKQLKQADSRRVGMWGHSMGGNITLRSLVLSSDIKVAVIWGGVVGSYDDLINHWHRPVPFKPSEREQAARRQGPASYRQKHGTPATNPVFWNAVDPTAFIGDIRVPVQLHHSLDDEEVPVAFSASLEAKLKAKGKTVELYTYENDNHNISANFGTAMDRSIAFFDRYLK